MNQLLKHKKYQRWTIYLIIALISSTVLAIEDAISEEDTLQDIIVEFLFFAPAIFLTLLAIGKLAALVLDRFYTNAIWTTTTWKKQLVILAMVLVKSILISALIIWVGRLIPDQDDPKSFFNQTWLVWVASLLFIVIAYSTEVFMGIIERQYNLELQNERLLRNQDLARYQALVHQINPHFLFNSLNVLSFLVHKDAHIAERFIEELSKIYRYILELNNAYVVPLRKELDFIQSYIYLQKLRYEDNLHFDSKIDAEALSLMLPPLTLELLVENAIKHNVIAPDHPLFIELSVQGKELIIKNNLKPRMEKNKTSLSIGIKNLKAKYQMLEGESPLFYTQNGNYIAKIPLFEPSL
ncbi:MAG: histidine kinase [Bacteroidota bacterium]